MKGREREIIDTFWAEYKRSRLDYNWGLHPRDGNKHWDIDYHWNGTTYEGLYINGVMLAVDEDYQGMFVLECVDVPNEKPEQGLHGDISPVGWLAFAHGIGGSEQWAWYESPIPQYFFKRIVKQGDVYRWAIGWYESIARELEPSSEW